MSEPDPLRVIIVDDEPLARGVVREYLGAHRAVTIVAECGNGFDAVKAVTELAPDLMFLDVQMPKLDGFEVLELLGRAVPVIFTTAYDQYALRAFEVHAVDYLLKPFSEERLAEALARARGRLAGREGEEPALDVDGLVAAARPRSGPLERVLIRDGAQVHVLPADRIDFVEAQDDYVCVHGRRQVVPEGSDDGGGRSGARPDALRAHSPLVSTQYRAHRAGRALRQGQPDCDSARRPQTAGEPGGVPAPVAPAVTQCSAGCGLDSGPSRFVK